MVKVYAARTLPVNPPDTPVLLSRNLLWLALQRKIRHATEFVPSMLKCVVISDKDGTVFRDCVLEYQNGKQRPMRETVTSYGQQWIIFQQEDGSVTTNLISNGRDNSDQDLQLTYFFEWNFPDVVEGTIEHDEAMEMITAIALIAVERSILITRKLVEEGNLKDPAT